MTLIIDDLGYDRSEARRTLALPPPFSVAILPRAPHARAIARAARRAGTDVLVHMPMSGSAEAQEPGVLHGDMNRTELQAGVRSALVEIPEAIGVSNHQGSALTANRAAMRAIMQALTRWSRPLLFVDSRTTAATEAERAARAHGLAVARRHVFLDHVRTPAAIEAALRQWLERARRRGCGLAIGHPYPQTLQILARELPRLDGVERVDLPTYIERCGTTAKGVARQAQPNRHAPGRAEQTAR